MIQELAVFPRYTLSSSQGLIGVRRWAVDHSEDLDDFVDEVCASHWPGNWNALPVSVQVGEFDDGTVIKQVVGYDEEDGGDVLSHTGWDRIGPLPDAGKHLVVANYQLLHIGDTGDEWPDEIPKPYHPPGTTLTLQVRGGGQMLLVAPDMVAGAPFMGGTAKQVLGEHQTSACVFVVPITEYHITCDRLTLEQLNSLFATIAWKSMGGYVNSDTFMGMQAETLLFDTWELDQTFAVSRTTPNRFRLKAVLRQREIRDPTNEMLIYGWNEDFTSDGWRTIKIVQAMGDTDGQKRYASTPFTPLFGEPEE